MTRLRRRLFAPQRVASVLAIALAAAVGSGCHAPPAGAAGAEDLGPPLPRVPVDEAAFARSVHRLLREGTPSRERSALLAGAVERQLAHAAQRFAADHDVRGTNAVVGALYLVRIGEARGDMYGSESLAALRGAIERFSARGDEGRALALMTTQIELLPPGSPERAELQEHLAALTRWARETRNGGDMARLSADERAAIGRALLDPSEEALRDSAAAIAAWIQRAIDYNVAYQETRKLPPREEIAEAYKALQVGAETMAALYLRYGRARGALDAIEGTAARGVTNPAFFTRLRAAAVDDTAEDWRLLARDFARMAFGGGEQMMDQALLEAALWGIAVEAYRRDPTSHAITHLLADLLVSLEMPEVAPLVLADALGPKPPVAVLSAALETVQKALGKQLSGSEVDVAAARRIFAASSKLLELGDAARFKGRATPSSAELRRLMAGIELEGGNAPAACELLVAGLAGEPSVRGFTLLAALERQLGRVEAALGHAQRGAALPGADPLEAAAARLIEHEILRDSGAGDRAAQALEAALGLVLAGKKGDTARAVRAEELLARVLDGYGERGRAAQALDRALHLAESHPPSLGGAMLTVVSRALVYRDLDAARAALQLGIKAHVDEEQLVYAALWVMLLERELGERGDGKVDRVLVEAIGDGGWVATLARWGRRTIGDAELRAAAATYGQKIEASFYLAMAARAEGAGDAALAPVAESPLVQLLEVQIARDLLAPKLAQSLPSRYEQVLSARD